MKASIRYLNHMDISQLITNEVDESDQPRLYECLFLSKDVRVGRVDGKLVCIWGVVPPSLMSNRAYLWLYVHERIKEYEFLFIRRSQLAVKEMLRDYDELYGVTDPHQRKTLRWLKWLGAQFTPNGKMLDFSIRKQ